MMRSFIVALVAAISFFFTSAQASNNMLLILDGSNSMWGQVDGTAKIETARGVLGDLLKDLPKDGKVGVMAYGHSNKESCKDVALLSPLAALDAPALKKTINDISPKGMTPIAYALEQGGKELMKHEQDTNSIVLISDGIETCNGDPCKAAETLAAANVGTKVHVVGFDVDDAAREQLKCIAEKGKGQYFDAANTESFKTAMAEVKKEVAVVVPTPPKKELKGDVWFEDDFGGSSLSDKWEVLREDANNYIVEDGKLMIVSGAPGKIQENNIPNVFKLKDPLPEGDWEVEAILTIEAKSALENFFMGSYDDGENWLVSNLSSKNDKYYGHKFNLGIHKYEGGKASSFAGELEGIRCNMCAAEWQWDGFREKRLDNRPIIIRLRKEGRSYVTSARIGNPGEENFKEIEALESLKMLRAKKHLILGFALNGKSAGESTVHVQKVTVKKLSAQ